MTRSPRQCQRCGRMNPAQEKECLFCATSLVKRRFRMTPNNIKRVHALARQKGLDDELYRLRLQAVGVKSSKDMKEAQFNEFIKGLNKLPDVRSPNDEAQPTSAAR